MAAPFISNSVLRHFRGMTESMMASTAVSNVLGTWVDDGGGAGHFEGGDPIIFPCRLTPMDKTADLRESLQGGQLDVTRHVMMHFPINVVGISSESRIAVDGVQYEIVGVPPLGTYSQHRSALLRKLTAEGL